MVELWLGWGFDNIFAEDVSMHVSEVGLVASCLNNLSEICVLEMDS